jgi:hypothetical protein
MQKYHDQDLSGRHNVGPMCLLRIDYPDTAGLDWRDMRDLYAL